MPGPFGLRPRSDCAKLTRFRPLVVPLAPPPPAHGVEHLAKALLDHGADVNSGNREVCAVRWLAVPPVLCAPAPFHSASSSRPLGPPVGVRACDERAALRQGLDCAALCRKCRPGGANQAAAPGRVRPPPSPHCPSASSASGSSASSGSSLPASLHLLRRRHPAQPCKGCPCKGSPCALVWPPCCDRWCGGGGLAPRVKVNGRSVEGQTALHFACAKNAASCAEVLVEGGADMRVVSARGATALHACYNNKGQACTKVVVSPSHPSGTAEALRPSGPQPPST